MNNDARLLLFLLFFLKIINELLRIFFFFFHSFPIRILKHVKIPERKYFTSAKEKERLIKYI